jgi:transcriptional regulator with XRE-family HTH domain
VAETQSRHPVDMHVGARIRGRRLQLQVSLKALGRSVGRSLQQVHAYESGANRVSASLLWEFAGALEVPVEYFFAGLAEAAEKRAQLDSRMSQVHEPSAR